MGGDPALQVRSLGRRFGGRDVVRSFDAELKVGERLALTGPNGSGKTTILRCVTGTLAPSSGEILVGGAAAGTLDARRQIGASLSQERSFYLRLTGTANLRFFARLRATQIDRSDPEVDSIVQELGLEQIAAQRVDRCSTGMVQQLAFARALLGQPSLLLLDEPTRSLDPAATERLWAAIDRRPQLAVVIATHRADDLEHCHRRIGLEP